MGGINYIFDLTAKTTADKFEFEWLNRYPHPTNVITDNGTSFISSGFKDLVQSYGIRYYPIPTYHPQSNGITEQIHKYIGSATRANHPEDLNQSLSFIAFAIAIRSTLLQTWSISITNA